MEEGKITVGLYIIKVGRRMLVLNKLLDGITMVYHTNIQLINYMIVCGLLTLTAEVVMECNQIHASQYNKYLAEI